MFYPIIIELFVVFYLIIEEKISVFVIARKKKFKFSSFLCKRKTRRFGFA